MRKGAAKFLGTIFVMLSILFSFFPSSSVSAEDWYNSSWLYRKAITISHSDDGAQTNYQVKIMIGENSDCNGHILSSFNDLRFTTSDGATLCDYWIENVSGVTPGLVARSLDGSGNDDLDGLRLGV